jgi:very-short-patch-repair endonuclease
VSWGNRWTEEKLAELRAKGMIKEHRIAQRGESLPANSGPKALRKPPRYKMSDGVRKLVGQISSEGLREPVLEHKFHGERRWRFDLCWHELKVAVEVEGGVYANGRHNRGKGFEEDAIKYNQAQILGWRVFRYSTGQVNKGIAIADLRKVLNG